MAPSVTVNPAQGTDIADNIHSALTSMSKVNGTVYVPAGSWIWSKRLYLPSNTRLICDQAAVFTSKTASHFLTTARVGHTPGGYGSQKDVYIEGGIWNCAKRGRGFAFVHTDGLIVKDVTVKDTVGHSHHMEINSSRNVQILGGQMIGTRDVGGGKPARDYDEAIQLDYAWPGAAVGSGNDGTPCLNVLIDGVYFGPSGTSGTIAPPRAIGGHQATTNTRNRHTNVMIRNCVVEGCRGTGGAAIRLYNVMNATVQYCTVRNTNRAISAIVGGDGCSLWKIYILDNLIDGGGRDGSAWDAIEVNAFVSNPRKQRITNLAITGNTVQGWRGTSGSYAIAVSDVTNGKISENVIEHRLSGSSARSMIKPIDASCAGVSVKDNVII